MREAILILATWRLTSLFVHEYGPFRIFHKIREWAGIIHDTDSNVIGSDDSFFAQLLECFWCTSIWVAAVLALLTTRDWSFLPFLILALSAGAIIIEQVIGGTHG